MSAADSLVGQPKDSWAVIQRDDADKTVHVVPVRGMRHTMEGTSCWCFPKRDSEAPKLVIHNEPN